LHLRPHVRGLPSPDWLAHEEEFLEAVRKTSNAIYSAGDYAVVDVAPDRRVQGEVAPGARVVAAGGKPVHEYVTSQHGETSLKLDPLGNTLYQSALILRSSRAGVTRGQSLAQGLELGFTQF
jgi:hypothetical protein